ncbi:slipin family protein [Candidatus Uhrbacteria bacterium]|nr:slipin family protein [Candidatus Uhrbacteria bacterium]MBD3284067.1 slipin family protein [Candidatus Uhrbacteria bacterium]
MNILLPLLPFVVVLILISIRQVNQYERGVKFTLGRYSSTATPGWRLVFPVIQFMRKVDMRVKAVDVPDQDAITLDNISCRINAVIYYKVVDASKAVLEVEHFWSAVSQLAQTTMRTIVGQMDLDTLLAKRDQASNAIKQIIEKDAVAWGLEIQNVELKDIVLPEDMKRTLAKQAEAERERRAVIIKSEGEVAAAQNLQSAAQTLHGTPGALHLRSLNALNDISSDQSNTLVFAVPLEVLRAFERLGKSKDS